MYFFLGIITGLVTAALIVATLTYFRRTIEHRVEILQKQTEATGPKPKGFIFEAPDEGALAREEIIQKNKSEGRDTHVKDLV